VTLGAYVEKGDAMTAIPHESSGERRQTSWLRLRAVWASLAISMIWLAVALCALFGPDITSTTVGGTTSTVPSGVAVAFFATIATWVVARYGLRERESA
jgi:hypothetical protein